MKYDGDMGRFRYAHGNDEFHLMEVEPSGHLLHDKSKKHGGHHGVIEGPIHCPDFEEVMDEDGEVRTKCLNWPGKASLMVTYSNSDEVTCYE